MIGIYKITSPSGKVYIGQSINIIKRFWSYRRMYCKKQSKLYSSFVSHGVKAHKFEVLQECEKEQLNDLEAYYMELFSCLGKNGLNLREAGNNGKTADSTKEKLRVAGIGNTNASGIRSEESLNNIRKAIKTKRKLPSDMGDRISKGILKSEKFKATMQSPEYKEKMRQARIGYKPSQETINKLKEAWKRRKNRV